MACSTYRGPAAGFGHFGALRGGGGVETNVMNQSIELYFYSVCYDQNCLEAFSRIPGPKQESVATPL